VKEYRLIVAGGRDYTDYTTAKLHIQMAKNALPPDTWLIILSGGCDVGTLTHIRSDGRKVYGADGLGERVAGELGFELELYDAEWDKFGRNAGPIRNGQMARVGDELLAFHDGKSIGTADMIKKARAEKLKVTIIKYGT